MLELFGLILAWLLTGTGAYVLFDLSRYKAVVQLTFGLAFCAITLLMVFATPLSAIFI